MSLSKGLSGSEFLANENFYFTSICSTGSRLYSSLKGEYFLEECLLNDEQKALPSIIDGHYNWVFSNTFTR